MTFVLVLRFWLILQCLDMVGSAVGLMIGAFATDGPSAIKYLELFLTIFTMTSGLFTNLGATRNPLIKFLSWVSPLRYANDLMFNTLIVDQPDLFKNEMRDFFGYDKDALLCFGLLMVFWLFYTLISWILLIRLAAK